LCQPKPGLSDTSLDVAYDHVVVVPPEHLDRLSVGGDGVDHDAERLQHPPFGPVPAGFVIHP
jgi:hypothetical protein